MQCAEFEICAPLLQVRIARIFNTYGPRMLIDDGRVVSNFVAQVRSACVSVFA
jgi:nucleoside-diphosphate-sugar epimerase